MANRVDPISKPYFGPLETAERVSSGLYFFNGGISLVVLLLEYSDFPTTAAVFKVLFFVAALLGLILSATTRLYLWPRAQEKRLADSLSNAFAVNLSAERTEGYFNNDEAQPLPRLGMVTLENLFFCQRQARLLWRLELKISGAFALAWCVAIFSNAISIDVLTTVGLVFFGEQVLIRLFRVQWLRTKAENLFDELFKVMQGGRDEPIALASVVQLFSRYEIAKALTAITFSEREFHKNNAKWSEEWEALRRRLENNRTG